MAVAAMTATVAAAAGVVDPANYGFAPDASPATNAAALQRALDGGKRIVEVTRPGVLRP